MSEVLLWNKLKNKQFHGLNFNRQKIIGHYIADLYCPELNLVIEIDGKSHESKAEYDLGRNLYLVGLGLYVLHIKDIDVKQRMGNVLTRIHSAMVQIQTGTAPEKNSEDWWA